MIHTPIVFLVFNRPELTRRVFERIREARPPKLLVVCDGAREQVPADAAGVAAVREIIAAGVDWPCEVLTNFAEKNMGCRERVFTGLNWAFDLVEEAIILEDDCLPSPSFFTFCEAMLERYRHEERVMHINGTNFLAPHLKPSTSYFFSKYVWVWGWATWRRAWRQYDPTMAHWDERLTALNASFDSRRERAFWMSTFDHARRDWKAANTWDFQWIHTCWTLQGLTVIPSANLIENLGFGTDATHTTSETTHLRLPSSSLAVDQHPASIARSRRRDDLMFCAYMDGVVNRRTRLEGALRVALQRWLNLFS